VAEITNPITALTQQDFLDLLDRVYPQHYLATLKSPGPGYELLQSYAAMAARVSASVETVGNDLFLLLAKSGAKATGSVGLFRQAAHPDGITVTVKAGSLVTTSKTGRDFVTLVDVVFGPMDLVGTPADVPIEAVSVGYEWNVPGETTTAAGEVLPGDIDTVKVLVEDPDYGDVTIQVYQTLLTSGGIDGALDALGSDRGLERYAGESDTAYRARVRALPDTISPAAFDRNMRLIFYPLDAGYDLIETWDIRYQTCWDAPPNTWPNLSYDPNLFAYDDPRDPDPFRGRWMDLTDLRGGVIVVVDVLPCLRDTGMSWDVSFDALEVNGARACCAYDAPADLNFRLLRGAWDGFDLTRQSVYKSAYDILQSIKGAGISAALELRGQ